MAEADHYNCPQQRVSEKGSPTPQMQTNPSKFYSHFLCRGLVIAIFIVLLPLFPSQAPEFINHTIFTRSWELIHLLFVGIAVSYGLFSRRNIESEKENQLKIDTAQTHVSRMLGVSSVFDDEVESPSGSDENKIQTWNSQYSRGEPMRMVAKETSDVGNRAKISRTVSGDKPLLLPVRSLRSRVSEPEELDLVGGTGRARSGDGSARALEGSSDSPRRDGSGESGEWKAGTVLPSPIPWQSRSGRMAFGDETRNATPRSYSFPLSPDADEFDRFESHSPSSPIHWSPRPNSSPSPSPKKLSPSPSLSPELRGKIGEDLGKKNNVYRRSPPPPPPLPPPISLKSLRNAANSNPAGALSLDDKDTGRSFKNEVKNLSRSSSREDVLMSRDQHMDSTRTKDRLEGSSSGKSARTIRAGEHVEARKGRDNGDGMEMNGGRRYREIDDFGAEKTGNWSVSNQSSIGIEKPTRAVRFPPPKIQRKESSEKIIVESEDSSGDETHERSDGEVSASASVADVGPDPNEVDKKADEFIAKFREQIRLQRIESIKKSSAQWGSVKPR